MILGLIALFGCVPLTFAAGDKDLIQKEKAVWQSVQDKKYDVFKSNFAADFRSVYAEGLNDLSKETAEVRKLDLKSFSLSDETVVKPDDNTAVMTYKVTTAGAADGKDVSGTYNCASVWQKSGAEWKVIFHTEVKAQAR